MLSYQHGYHAGHFADVHKHTALCLILRGFRKQAAPFFFMDSHAGRGRYDLGGAQAAKTGEWRAGIGKLWGTKVSSEGLALYLATVRAVNGGGGLRTYPGSPLVAAHMARACDRLCLMELHPAEYAGLKRAMARVDNAEVLRSDGFDGLLARLPPEERSGLALVDPSYELKDEYARVPATVAQALARWPGGVFMAWYPILPDDRHAVLRAGFDKIAAAGVPVLIAELEGPPPPRGLRGTGLAIVNPPPGLRAALATAGDEMAARLFPAGAGRHGCTVPSA